MINDDITLFCLMIGSRERLAEADAIDAARAFRLARVTHPSAAILIAIDGYDEDQREIWQIKETRSYMQLWAKHAGLSDWRDASLIPWEGGLGLALLQMSGVFADDSPIKVTIK